MTATNRGAAATGRTGHTRITKSALTHTAEAVAAAVFGVPRREVRVALADDGGSLGITVSVPLPAPSLLQVAQDPSLVEHSGGTVFDRAARARDGIRETAQQITGSQVGRIDIRLTGIRPPAERKPA